jgi:hypothetical protein
VTPGDIATWVGGGAGLGGLLLAIAALAKARPEARKVNADAAKVFTDASATFAVSVATQMEGMRAELAEVKRKLREREEREDRQERLLLVHERWDYDVAHQVRQLGGEVSDPPPLYPDSTNAA